MFYVLRTGCPWRDLPARYGPWKTVYNRFNGWSRAKVIDRIVAYLVGGPISPTSFSAPQHLPLNVAEGAGELSRKDKARFYRMARRSATECAAILDVCQTLRLLANEEALVRGRNLLIRIVSMLVPLARRSKKRPGTGTGTGDQAMVFTTRDKA
jgi:hypothetical protein